MNSDVLVSFSYYGALLLFALGAAGSLLLRRHDTAANLWSNTAALTGSVLGLVASLRVLLCGEFLSHSVPTSFPLLSLSLHVDRLSGFFVFIISLIGVFASLYALGYVKHYYGKQNIGELGLFYNIFLGSMILVVSASNGIFFLIVWEVMSLASYFLVIYEKEKAENIQAGSLYFIMTHAGTAFIILLFLFLYGITGSFDFAQIRLGTGGLSYAAAMTLSALALIGFGTKAGMVPLHIWLPYAHPAAPSHVSALMSGVMIKTGIYMLFRIFFDLLPDHVLMLGIIVLILGSVSALLGVLYALAEHDLKKLLACHSIENIGIILLGMGSALVFSAMNMRSLAILGFVAALFHTLNHAVFKALLFLSAGSVIAKTHTRNMEEYGGIIRYMPLTALFFLVGSMAISALPPFNGFFSEWMTFQSLFSGIGSFDLFTKGIFMIAAGSLALTGGLAAACFVKAFGITFLARPRSEEIKQISESGNTLTIAMACLAALALLLGLFSGVVTGVLSQLAAAMPFFKTLEAPMIATTTSITLTNGFAGISAPLQAAIFAAVFLIVWLAVRLLTAGNRTAPGPTWDCGAAGLTPRMEITATGFSRSLVTIFQGVLKPSIQSEIEYRDARMRYFPRFGEVILGRKYLFIEYLYTPLNRLVLALSEKAKKIQGGSVNWYVLYIFVALVILLLIISM